MPQLKQTEIRYDFNAIDFMDRKWDRFYDMWLDSATDHALQNDRTTVLREDVEATLPKVLDELAKHLK